MGFVSFLPFYMEQQDRIVILGAGLSGALLACFLANRGFLVDIYERRDDMRKVEMSAGRSINLALSERGIVSLDAVGLKDEIMQIAVPMKGRMMHDENGKLTFQSYSKDGNSFIYSVSRGELNCKLMTLAERNPNVRIIFSHRCLGVNVKEGEITLQNEITKEVKTIKPLTTFACDGAFSAARTSMLTLPR